MNSNNDSSNKGSQRIEATQFDVPGAPVSSNDAFTENVPPTPRLTTTERKRWWHSQFNLMLAVFSLLAVAAVLFVVLTPPPQVKSLSTVVEVDGSTRQAQSTESEEVAPWDESRRAQARTDSQDILADLLDLKKELEAKNVSDWAPEQFDAVMATAAEGDDFYKKQDFAQAIGLYKRALDEMQGLNKLMPDILAAKVAEGNEAIDQGKTALAREKFEEALKLDQNNIPALRGLDRAKTLDQVLEIVRAAALDEQEFSRTDDIAHLNSAQQKLQQALQIDERMEPAKQGLIRVRERMSDKQFRDSMSSGFNALFSRNYGSARKGFSSALKARPNDSTATAAYRQSLASGKRTSLGSLLKAAKRFEKQEEWASAVSNYQTVLQRDANQVGARLGQIRSQARLDLDQQINDVLSDTLALSRNSQNERATSVLNDARAIKSKGPKLKSQISSMEAALQQIGKTVKVSLVSDALTEISLTKAGANKISLGRFKNKNLALKPGRYVISGTRLGYRDVRREIELQAGVSLLPATSRSLAVHR